MKGMRVQSIIRELRGEKIDIIEYSDDPVVFATHALSPAKVSRISILDPLEKHMEVIVDDSQLSLAIGKKGQNVRLAAKLLTWKIDIKSEEEKRQEVESAMAALVAPGAPVSVLIEYGLAEALVEKLLETGVGTIEKLGGMTPEQLEEIQGIEPQMVGQIQDAVNAYYSQFEDSPAAPNAEEPPAEEEVEASGTDDRFVSSVNPAGEHEPAEEEVEAAPEDSGPEQFATIEDAASSPAHVAGIETTQNQPEGTGPEGMEHDERSPEHGQ
ncbi:Transcription termination/antitermination protein NusA (fragment) [Candidatus Sulfopaludibacter sp. SbA4]